MRGRLRHFFSLAMVAIIVLASSASGYAAYAPHDKNVDVGHVLGGQVGDHHSHPALDTQIYVVVCDIHASCDAEPGDTASHIHICCLGSSCIAVNDIDFKFAATPGDQPIALSPLLLAQELFTRLLRPPRVVL